MSMIEKWEPILENLKFYNKHFVDKIIDWCPYGEHEILISANDGWRYIYDDSDHHIRLYVERNDDGDMDDESVWRDKFSKRLCSKIHRLGITQGDLSDMTGISSVTLSSYMNGRSTPSTYNLLKIAKALGCNPESLTDV